MNTLLQQIRAAQVRAGEDAVCSHLESLGLIKPVLPMTQISYSTALELLEGCKNLIAYCDKHPPMGESLYSVTQIRAAVAKIEGELT